MKKTCPSCGGSGQINYFKGVSRFLLTTEECPECFGIGHLQEKKGEKEMPKPGDAAGQGNRRKK